MRAHRYRMLLPTVCVVLAMPLAAQGQQVATPQPPPSRPAAVAPSERVPAPTPSPTLDSLGMRGFSVALVIGEMQGSATPDTLPAGARKALTDMRDFLPYKSYRMLDAQWTLCCAGRQGAASGRLRGLEEEEYAFEAYVVGMAGSKLHVTFRLREAPSAHPEDALVAQVSRSERERNLADLARQREALAAEQAELTKKYGGNHPQRQANEAQRQEVHRRIAEIERTHGQAGRSARSSRSIMENTFSMDVGETVVIGTSRLKGDKALIALLTAASRTSSTREP